MKWRCLISISQQKNITLECQTLKCQASVPLEQPTLLHLLYKVGGRRDSSILVWWEPMGVTLMTLWRKWLSTSSMSSPPKLSTTSLINKLLDLIWFYHLFLLSSLKTKQKATGFFLFKKNGIHRIFQILVTCDGYSPYLFENASINHINSTWSFEKNWYKMDLYHIFLEMR